MARDNVKVIFAAVFVVLVVTLYFHNKMAAMARGRRSGESWGQGHGGGDLYLTNVEMGRGEGRGEGLAAFRSALRAILAFLVAMIQSSVK